MTMRCVSWYVSTLFYHSISNYSQIFEDQSTFRGDIKTQACPLCKQLYSIVPVQSRNEDGMIEECEDLSPEEFKKCTVERVACLLKDGLFMRNRKTVR